MPSAGKVLPRNQLPSNYRIQTREMHNERKKRIPKWMSNAPQMKRILGVYDAYLKRTSLPEIAETFGISVSQIYTDIHRAEEVAAWHFMDDMGMIVLQQVEARRLIVQEARTEIRNLQDPLHGILMPADKRAKAVADLLRVIAEQERAIEEILTVRNRNGTIPPERIADSMAPPAKGGSMIIDLTGEIVEADEPDAIEA